MFAKLTLILGFGGRRILLTALALTLLPLPASSAFSAVEQVSTSIVNGQLELAEPSTGALIFGDTDSGYATCSVILIGCDTAITTAHCFNTSPEQKTWVYFQHAGFQQIESATRHPAYAAAITPPFPPDWLDILRVEDISFIKFVTPVTGVTPSTLTGAQPALDSNGIIVGFGRDPITAVSAGSVDRNAGIKRSGSMQLSACQDSLAGFDILCWEPPVPQGTTGEDVSTCEGDSGGPLFVDEGGTRVVAGVTKGTVFESQGQSDLCVPPVHPYDTSVFRHLDWISGGTGAGGMVSQTGAMTLDIKTCGSLPQFDEEVESGDAFGNCISDPWVEGETLRTCGFSGFLNLGTASDHQFDVPVGTELLRVGFNGIASASLAVDTNFYLRAGAPATSSTFDCKADGLGNVGFCESADPADGTWYARVEQDLYHGEYQVTVSLFRPVAQPSLPSLGPLGTVGLAALIAAGGLAGVRRRTARLGPKPT